MTEGWLRVFVLYLSPSALPIPRCRCPVYERHQSRLARLYGFINGGFRLQVEGGARGASAQGALGLLGLLDLWARRILGHHQVAF